MGLGLDARSAPSGGFGSAWWTDEEMNKVKEPQAENRKGKAFVDGCDERMKDMNVLMKQIFQFSRQNFMLQVYLINPTSRSCPRVGMGLPGILMRCTMKY